MLSIPDEVSRIVSPGRWYAMDCDEQEELLDWLYDFDSMLTHMDPQDAERAEGAFEERDCFCNGGEFICSPDCYHP